jgi:methyl-accepting chemotaxis protein
MQIAKQPIGVAFAVLIASVGFGGTRIDLGKAAERLEEQTRIAAAHGDTVSEECRLGARELAKLTTQFRSAVETSTVGEAEVSARFERVANSYHRFREQVEHANTRQAFADLDAVTSPYQDVERDLGIAPDTDTRAAK